MSGANFFSYLGSAVAGFGSFISPIPGFGTAGVLLKSLGGAVAGEADAYKSATGPSSTTEAVTEALAGAAAAVAV